MKKLKNVLLVLLLSMSLLFSSTITTEAKTKYKKLDCQLTVRVSKYPQVIYTFDESSIKGIKNYYVYAYELKGKKEFYSAGFTKKDVEKRRNVASIRTSGHKYTYITIYANNGKKGKKKKKYRLNYYIRVNGNKKTVKIIRRK